MDLPSFGTLNQYPWTVPKLKTVDMLYQISFVADQDSSISSNSSIFGVLASDPTPSVTLGQIPSSSSTLAPASTSPDISIAATSTVSTITTRDSSNISSSTAASRHSSSASTLLSSSASGTPSPSTTSTNQPMSLGNPQIAGIAIGTAMFLWIVVFLAIYFFRKKRNHKNRAEGQEERIYGTTAKATKQGNKRSIQTIRHLGLQDDNHAVMGPRNLDGSFKWMWNVPSQERTSQHGHVLSDLSNSPTLLTVNPGQPRPPRPRDSACPPIPSFWL